VELSAKNNIVANGFDRFTRAKRAASSEDIEQKYAKELMDASPAQKLEIRKRMAQEYLRREKIVNHKPSPGTLW
jgi:hypothetical protein